MKSKIKILRSEESSDLAPKEEVKSPFHKLQTYARERSRKLSAIGQAKGYWGCQSLNISGLLAAADEIVGEHQRMNQELETEWKAAQAKRQAAMQALHLAAQGFAAIHQPEQKMSLKDVVQSSRAALKAKQQRKSELQESETQARKEKERCLKTPLF